MPSLRRLPSSSPAGVTGTRRNAAYTGKNRRTPRLVNTVCRLSGGRAPRSAVARKAPASSDGHGLTGRPSDRCRRGEPSLFTAKRGKAVSSFFPPRPPIPSPARFTGEGMGTRGKPAPKGTRSAFGLLILSIHCEYGVSFMSTGSSDRPRPESARQCSHPDSAWAHNGRPPHPASS